MKYLIGSIVVLGGLAAFVLMAGWLVPAQYETGAIITVDAPPEAVWQVLSAVDGYPQWRSEVAMVERIGAAADLAWREMDAQGGATRHRAEEGRAPGKFVDRFVAAGAAGNRGVAGGVAATNGERVILIVADEKGKTRVAITEKGEIRGPLARFRARFATGYDAGVRKLAQDLRKRLGE
jgi:hypothetical protein